MATWQDFEDQRPEMASAGRSLLYKFGVGLGFLATVRPDGGPRVHPICPVMLAGRIFALIVQSPKRADLLNDGRYALHSFPMDDNEDAIYLVGMAHQVRDQTVVDALVEQYVAERAQFGITAESIASELPFEFDIEKVMLTVTKGHGDQRPVHTVWVPAPSSS
jgi:hypothetical protein